MWLVPLGISSAVPLFQRQKEEVLGVAASVKLYLDDALNLARLLESYLPPLDQVLTELSPRKVEDICSCTGPKINVVFLSYKVSTRLLSYAQGC